MRISINAYLLDKGMTGTGRYILNLINKIPEIDNRNEYFLFSTKNLNIEPKFYKNIKINKINIPPKLYSP